MECEKPMSSAASEGDRWCSAAWARAPAILRVGTLAFLPRLTTPERNFSSLRSTLRGEGLLLGFGLSIR